MARCARHPLSGLRRTSPFAGGRINRSMLSCRDMAPWLSIHSPTAPRGEDGAVRHQRGMHFRRPQGGCMVLYKLAPSINLNGALHGSYPLSEAMHSEHDLQERQRRTNHSESFPLWGATFLHNPWHQGPEARWMPYAPLRRRRRPLREYRKAPPRSRSRPRHNANKKSCLAAAGRLLFIQRCQFQ